LTALLIECPHCGVKDQIAQGGHAVGGWEGVTHWLVRSCNSPLCKKPIFVVYDENQAEETANPIFTYPLTGGKLDNDTDFPNYVREEFREATHCHQIGAYLSSMTMSRRVLQRCLKHEGFNQRKLFEQIKAAKEQNLIPKRYSKLVDEIRHYGNIGAHPDDDKMDLVNETNSEFLLGLVKLLVEEFYVVHDRITKLERARNEKA